QVFPNPFREQASFRVEGISGRELQLELFDLQGRLAHRQSSSFTDNLMLRRESLPPGLYIFRLSVDGVMLAQGKVLVQ
ncbi:MAG: T9SS type A sorting domain-containing protein, partial [Phaeodactylibacter sp.]|nr:T9SS type A sorting domain-containing protein [Phaeodactylibacter sp.]